MPVGVVVLPVVVVSVVVVVETSLSPPPHAVSAVQVSTRAAIASGMGNGKRLDAEESSVFMVFTVFMVFSYWDLSGWCLRPWSQVPAA